jgi:hypothetical protein
MTENIINPLHRLGRVVFGRWHDGMAILGGKRSSGRPAKVLGPGTRRVSLLAATERAIGSHYAKSGQLSYS